MAQPYAESISAVVPTFNDVARIGDALTSIVDQTTPPAEIVVSDDGSDDGTEQFVSEFATRQAGEVAIRYVRSSHMGSAAARNAGIAAARGEWIANCDSDDIWAPAKLERQTSFLRDWTGSRRIALLGTHGYNINDAKKVISPLFMGPTTEDDYNVLREEGGLFHVIHSSALFSREDFLAVGGYSTEYGAADDWPFFCRMADRGVVVNLPEPLVYYRKRAGSVQLARFSNLHQSVARLAENERRRVAGQAPISSDEFAAQLASAPAWQRLKHKKQMWGMYYYRCGAVNLVNRRRLRGASQLALASIMDGARVRSGVRNAAQARFSQHVPVRASLDHRSGGSR